MNYRQLIDKYYPVGSRLRDIYLLHCRSVAHKALEINTKKNLGLNIEDVEAAAMLHDIGIFLTDAPGIDCHGELPYLSHGIAGAKLLRDEGFDEKFARICERHTGAGITVIDIEKNNLPIPSGDYVPETPLERLICYADKFFSKSGDMKEKSLERVRASMLRLSPESLDRFELLHNEFGS